MKLRPAFHPDRFLRLLRFELLTHSKPAIISTTIVVGSLSCVFLIYQASDFVAGLNYFHTFALFSFLGFASAPAAGSFKDLHCKETSAFFLTQPASMEEKFLCRLLLTTIAPMATLCLVLYLFTQSACTVSQWHGGPVLPIFNPFSPPYRGFLSAFLFYHPIFFLGGIAFRRYPFLKTLMVLSLGLTALILFIGALGWNLITTPANTGTGLQINLCFLSTKVPLGKYFAWIISYGMPPFLWIATYLKLKEYEA